MKSILKLFKMLDKPKRIKSFYTFVIVAFMAVTDAIGVASIMPFLTILGNPEILETDPSLSYFYRLSFDYGIQNESEFLILLAIIVFLLILFAGIYRTFAVYSLNNLIEGLRADIGQKIFRGFLYQKYSFFIENNTSDLAKTVLSEVDNLTGSVLRPTFHMLANIVSCTAIILILFLVNPILLIVTFLVLGVLYYSIYRTLRVRIEYYGQQRFLTNKERFFWVNEAFTSIKFLKLRHLEETFVEKFGEPADNFAKSVSLFATINQAPKYFIEVIAFGGLLSLIIFLMYSNNGMVVGDVGGMLPTLGLYAFATYRLQPSFQAIFNGLSSLRFGAEAIDHIANLLTLHTVESDYVEPVSYELKHGDIVSLKGISFAYPGSRTVMLDNLNLTIPVGNRLAIVGKTGAGKTTLIDILLGLITPDQGHIELIGRGTEVLDLKNLQPTMGYVPQDVVLSDGTITENIAFGVSECFVDHDRVRQCVEVAQMKQFVEHTLPHGYNSKIGQRGIKLSGGQRQRLGIARALYDNPKIIIFDEATSALDHKTEESVMSAINSTSNGITLIFITHRLTTIQNCDNIYLLESGKLINTSYKDLEKRF